VLGEGTLGYKVMLITYRVCLEKASWVIKYCCYYTGCAWKRDPGFQSNADNIQGVLGEGTLGYKVLLLLYRVCLVKALWVTKSC